MTTRSSKDRQRARERERERETHKQTAAQRHWAGHQWNMLVESSLALSCVDVDSLCAVCIANVSDICGCKCRASFTSFTSTLFDIDLRCLSHASGNRQRLLVALLCLPARLITRLSVNFDDIFHSPLGPKSKKKFVKGKNLMTSSPILPQVFTAVMHSQRNSSKQKQPFVSFMRKTVKALISTLFIVVNG